MNSYSNLNSEVRQYKLKVRKIALIGALKSFVLSLGLDFIGGKMMPATFATSFLLQALFSFIVDVRIIRQSGLEVYQAKYELFADQVDAARSAATSELISSYLAQQKFKLATNIVPIFGAFYTATVVYRSICKIGDMTLADVAQG
ncbi:hypothetical protein [Desulfuribacillus alkaliarsenatis]|uniref:Uncharacterized protein n=1 Tax=Desulfuribacillus alkaliarsenatis TaxID=766136 RepID=A0A1E5G0X3_9FIRM|nr:hypothetical protein [Desulfuribacillus alkaliarsenatis]OEF96543.1 hypothetical protein BHF68_07795 [Desulfuribacillus alkaliarsenatis]